MGGRLAVLISIVFIAYSILGFHLYTLQVSHGDRYFAQASAQQSSNNKTNIPRGSILFTDKNGNEIPAAINKDVAVAYAVPKAIDDPLETANAVSELLHLDKDDLAHKFSNKNSTYVLLAKKISSEAVDAINGGSMKGVYTEYMPSRFYPSQSLSSQVLGFVSQSGNDDGDVGRYGTEKFYEKTLAQGGDGVTLTIDPTIETEGERIVGDLVKNFHAKGGTVIVEDPKSGKILAMGSTPQFDPNRYSDSPLSSFVNPAVEGIYEPGSVFKVITMAAGLDAGKITPTTSFYDTGALLVSGKKIQNWDLKAHGTVTMTNVIEESLNTGAAFAERQIGDTIFQSYLRRFGFGDKTGVDLPGEIKGDLRRLQPKAPAIAFATASFGQGVAVTPLQMVNAVSVIANGGRLMRPYLNAALSSKVIRDVISSEAASQTAAMMVSAVDKAEVAHIKGYTIAGKTGTAQVPDFVHGGYADGKVINTYIGFGPVSDPKFIILIKLVEPEGAPLAGQTVVPAFRELAQFLLNYYNVTPDRP